MAPAVACVAACTGGASRLPGRLVCPRSLVVPALLSCCVPQVVDRAMDVCIKRCVSSKDARLTESQKACLTGCTMAFMEGFGLAADTMQALLKKEAGSR